MLKELEIDKNGARVDSPPRSSEYRRWAGYKEVTTAADPSAVCLPPTRCPFGKGKCSGSEMTEALCWFTNQRAEARHGRVESVSCAREPPQGLSERLRRLSEFFNSPTSAEVKERV